MRTQLRLLGVAVVGLALRGFAAAEAAAPPEGPGLRLSGFGTIGVTHVRAPAGGGFRGDIDQPPNDRATRADIDSRLGLQLDEVATPQLEFAAQALLRRRVGASVPVDSLESAYASYRPTPAWTLRAGRTQVEAFLLSDYRRVGFAYLWVRPEVGFYGGLPIYSVDGVDVARSWESGDARWRLEFFTGSGAGYGAFSSEQPASKVLARGVLGLTATRESGGLSLRATALRVRVALDQIDDALALSGALRLLGRVPLPAVAAEAERLRLGLSLDPSELTYFEAGASYESAAWLLSAELLRMQGGFAGFGTVAGYLSLGRRCGDLTPYLVLAASRSGGADAQMPAWSAALAPLLGPQGAAAAQQLGEAAALAINAQRQQQRSVSLGVRWDVAPRAALKLQWDRYVIGANGHLLWSDAPPQAAAANVLAVVLDFVF